ncbi:YlbF family regulator [Liquorilactobacillus satsumensis]|uniref:Uncharacterized protein n=1 Tax=Liquorilactobacillus satsumensis DSM 16230 = JCM 12392 TaxID=1423801 RepID=A0A0R1V269_9LACO|nr:YlbF family regulator [Liquorilactobacillus satsumensis]KRL99692.1 hypothetical protein FD50_GL000006 [Liquorilactobacillus satsumensis DSM 16230 = JCM 12392]MCP9313627.1 YlbF family regulator [Liquorilactobacillus satsumensis]MCP9328291.1 YlbF family regulator [Liquorilactobacillus satsumensis]MCP9360755.1 YlbF family regulator [Liquorilactobacillus satsumensis]
MSNLYDAAYEFEDQIRQSAEFKALTKAYNQLKTDDEAFAEFKKLQKMQIEFGKKQVSGKVEQQDLDALTQEGKKASSYKALLELEEKEQTLAKIIDEVHGIMFKPVEELYTAKD